MRESASSLRRPSTNGSASARNVFQAYHPILDEAAAALDRAGQSLSAHLAGAERVTGERKAERMLSS
jgi:hypothetical protein